MGDIVYFLVKVSSYHMFGEVFFHNQFCVGLLSGGISYYNLVIELPLFTTPPTLFHHFLSMVDYRWLVSSLLE